MSVWSWNDVDWGAGGTPEWIRTRLTPVGPKPVEVLSGDAKDSRPKKRRFRLTPDGEQKAVALLGRGKSAVSVAADLRVPPSMIEAASRRAGPHDCAYGCGPTRTTPASAPLLGEDTVRQRMQCGCEKARCWIRVTMRERE